MKRSLFVLLAITGCPKTETKPDAGPEPLPSRCQPFSEWDGQTPAFRHASADWGLEGLVVKGTRINVLDIDDDGRPDLLVRNGDGPDDFGPEGARKRWLLRNTGSGFEDITAASGLFTDRQGNAGALIGGTVAAADVNNDGHTDIMIGAHSDDGSKPGELMLGDGNGGFVHGPEGSAARRAGQPSVASGLAFTDFDRDGRLDLWATQNKTGNQNEPMPDQLFGGDGNGGFADRSAELGVQSLSWGRASIAQMNDAQGHSWSWGATACDLSGDGLPELLSPAYGRAPNHLWLSSGTAENPNYSNASVSSGYAYDDNQDWHDNESARCWCKINPNDPGCNANIPDPRITCSENSHAFRWRHSSDREAWRLGGNSGGTLCADIDNDGNMDLLTSEIVHWDVGRNSDEAELLFGNGRSDLRLERPGNEATGLNRRKPGGSWDEGIITGNVIDVDNDGLSDILFGGTDYPGNRALLYRQVRPREFQKITSAAGFDFMRAHGSGVADFDGDGDLDVVLGHSRMRCGDTGECLSPPIIGLFENQLGGGNWIQLRLEGGEHSNRWAVGARVLVEADGMTQTQELSAGQGHYGNQNARTLHFGLGAACEARVTIIWPDAERSEQVITAQSGYRYDVVQGKAPVANNR